ncbi:uncharacterized protein LOC108834047 [Raphanus sativus]|uniref:Uncharacterized protein LOC108834047 n=1 Tax=Raphanus sativus TaxID=3726 RepID=A0A6J0LSS3_RAPSA|nr:uncharacterized protein LOC108834047 [Raphanus sativus]
MVFADGRKKSVEGILDVFNEFDRMSGLKISMEKSVLFVAGTSVEKKEEILEQFQFTTGDLPVRYLCLPLLTKNMTINDYLPLIEKIRKKISTWTGRFLTYAGRLQLINSVIMSLTNFWMAAFRLPSSCIKEIERLCSAFLWSGPDLNGRKAKIAWSDVCRAKSEGGLGLRPLKEVNMVSCLKLIWRILSANSLWVNWVKVYLIRKGSIWMIKDNTQAGSWMWRKVLKYREIAKSFYRVEVRSGEKAYFWFEVWSSLGCLKDILRERGCIGIGILIDATVADSRRHRRRHHRDLMLNKVEEEIEKYKLNLVYEEDISLWRNGNGKYKRKFSTRETWICIRERHLECNWHKAIWFKNATPKFSFITWIAMHGRLSTGDRMRSWYDNVDASCVLCQEPLETRNHLFFEYSYSEQIWRELMRGVMQNQYTSEWDKLIDLLTGSYSWSKIQLFIIKYMLQSTVYAIWRERNRRKHGETPRPTALLTKQLDKNIRNRITIQQRKGDKELAGAMAVWFGTR